MDKHAQVAIGRFEENAGSGYLLKPQYLRPKEKYQARIAKYTFDAVAGLMTPPPPMKLIINVISAQQLPPLSIKRVPDDVPALPTSPTSPTSPASPTSPTATTADPTTNPTTNPTADPTTDPTAPTTTIVTPIVTDAEIVTVPVMNPLVRVTLHDNQGDGAGFSTDVVMDNFFNPVWNKVFTFNVCNSEIAVLNFEILHESADDYFDENGNNCGKKRQLIAFSSLPVRCMREGLRLCKLYDQDGCRGEGLVASTLLVRTLIEVEDDANTGKKEDASASTEEKDD